jgi:peroxiredoxin
VLTRIKQTPALSHIPVAMLSGLEDSTLAEVCLHQGAVEVLLKPLKVEAIARAVKKYCKAACSSADTTADDSTSASTYSKGHSANGSQQMNRQEGVLAIGDIAPDFSLPDTDLKMFALGRFLENTAGLRQLVLVFVPCFESMTTATTTNSSSSSSSDVLKAATTAACVQLLTTVNKAYCEIKAGGQHRSASQQQQHQLSSSTSSNYSDNRDTDVIGIGQCFSQADNLALAHWVNKLGLDYRVLTDSSLGLVWKVSQT